MMKCKTQLIQIDNNQTLTMISIINYVTNVSETRIIVFLNNK